MQRYEFNLETKELYDKETDFYLTAKRHNSHNFLYQNPMTGALVGVNLSWDNTVEIDDYPKIYHQWFGTEIALNGFIVDTKPKSIKTVYEYLKANMPDDYEYFQIDYEIRRESLEREPYPVNARISVYVVTGGSEGHYIHVEADKKPLYMLKTFQGFDAAWQRAADIAKLLDA